jgi:MoxR-like ATPase
MEPQDVLALQRMAANIRFDAKITEYAVRIVRATRGWHGIELGAGPRGSVSLLRAARAHALLRGNQYVTPDDVKAVAPAVMRHRIKLTADLEIEGYHTDAVIDDLLAHVDAPRR